MLIILYRLVEPAQVLVRGAEIVKRLRITRLQLDRCLVAGNGFVESSQLL